MEEVLLTLYLRRKFPHEKICTDKYFAPNIIVANVVLLKIEYYVILLILVDLLK